MTQVSSKPKKVTKAATTKAPAKAARKPKKTTTAPKKQAVQDLQYGASQSARGVFFALGAIPAGIVAWLALWHFGIMASFAAFFIAWLSVRLYTIGSGGMVTRRGAQAIVGVIVIAVVLSFLAGMASDALDYYHASTKLGYIESLTSAPYWNFLLTNLVSNPDLWKSYTLDIVVAIVFSVLGASGIIREVLKNPQA